MLEIAWRIVFLLIVLMPFGSWQGLGFLPALYVCSCLVVSAIVLFMTAKATPVRTGVLLVVAPVFLLCVYLFLQLTPMSQQLLSVLSPPTWEAYSGTVWVVEPHLRMPLSVYSEATTGALLYACAVIGLCLAVGQYVTDRKLFAALMQHIKIAILVWSVTAVCLTVVDIFLPEQLTDLQFLVREGRQRLFLWAVCLTPVIVADIISQRPRVTRRPLLDQIHDFVKAPAELPHFFGIMTMVVMVFCLMVGKQTFLVFTCFVGILIYLLINYGTGGKTSSIKRWALVSSGLLAFAGIFVWGHELLRHYWDNSMASVSRNGADMTSWIKAWFGCGLGGDIDIAGMGAASSYYMEPVSRNGGLLALWFGIGGWGMLLISLTTLLSLNFARGLLRARSGRGGTRYYAGGVASILLFLLLGDLTAYLDWSTLLLGIPLTVLLIMLAQVSRQPGSFSRKALLPRRCITVVITLGLSASLVIAALFHIGKTFEWALERNIDMLYTGSPQQDDAIKMLDSIKHMAFWNPIMGRSARLAVLQGQLEFYLGHDEQAVHSYTNSMAFRPMNPQTIMVLATLYAQQDKPEMAMALLNASPVKHFRPDAFFDRVITKSIIGKQDLITSNILRIVLNASPERSGKYLGLMMLSDWENSAIEDILPDHPLVWMAYGEVLLTFDNREKADAIFLKAVDMQTLNPATEAISYYGRIVDHFLETDQVSNALKVARSAVATFPDDYRIRRLAAELHERLGYAIKADQEFSRANLLEVSTQ